MHFQIEVEREEDGRWMAEVPDLPGVIVYGTDRASAVAKAQALAVRVLAERLEEGGAEYLQERARRGSRAKYEAALAEVPDVEPEAYDRLAEAAALLDAAEERALAEEGVEADFQAFREDQDGRSGEQESEVTARLDELYGRECSSLEAALRRATSIN